MPEHYDANAADSSEIQQLFTTEEASVVHCTLPPKATSVATYNVGIHKIWYFIGGWGRFGSEERMRPREQ